MVTRMREKGQITIPADIREDLHLTKDSILSVFTVGDAIILTPKKSKVRAVSEKFQKAAQKENISLDDLLKELKQIRKERG